MKRIFLLILPMIFCYASLAYSNFDPFPENKGLIYAYNQDDLPEICFFGEGFRWDGYSVTAKDWNKLTDYQKTAFISEGAAEIEKNEAVAVDLGDGWDVLVAVNEGVKVHKEASNIDVPMIKFLRDTLNTVGLTKTLSKNEK